MVNPGTERRNFPAYALARVSELASAGKVQYAGSRIFRHVANLAFRHEDVCQCLQALQESDFSHAERYEDDPRWRDVYKTRYPGPDGRVHDLYIKFLLDRGCVLILLNSFHPEGAI